MKTKTQKMLPKILRGSVHKQFKKCGKSNCKCVSGELHGAYYYHFVREDGKLKKRYLKATEVEPTRIACIKRQEAKKALRANLKIGWQQFREIRAEIRDLTEDYKS